MDIVAYLRMLRRHWKLIVAATAAGALLGAASTLATSSDDAEAATYYKATHTLFLDTSSINDQVRPVYTNLDQIAVLVTTGEVPRRVEAELGGRANEWTTHIFTVTNGTTNTLDIICAEPEPDEAVNCADTFAAELMGSIEEREQTRFNDERDKTIQRLDSLETQIESLDAQLLAQPGGAEVIQAQRRSLVNAYSLEYQKFQQLATQGGPSSVVSTLEAAEPEPISKAEYDERILRGQLGENRVRADGVTEDSTIDSIDDETTTRFSGPASRGILGGILGMMLGVGLAVVADRVDRRIRTRQEVEAAFGLPVLAEIPALTAAQQKNPALLSASAPLSRTAEAYRAVRSSLMFQRATDTRPRHPDDAYVVLVGSAGPKEGKTTTSANLAVMFAETGQRVLAINCDFRRPSLHDYFALPNEPRRVFSTTIPGLWVVTDVTSGPSRANPAYVLEEQRRLVASARKRFDVIVLDTAPMLTTNDATEIIPTADVVVVVSRVGVTTSDGAQRARELLSRIAAPVSGVVLLGSEASPNEYYYYYYSRGRVPATGGEQDGSAKGASADASKDAAAPPLDPADPWFDPMPDRETTTREAEPPRS